MDLNQVWARARFDCLIIDWTSAWLYSLNGLVFASQDYGPDRIFTGRLCGKQGQMLSLLFVEGLKAQLKHRLTVHSRACRFRSVILSKFRIEWCVKWLLPSITSSYAFRSWMSVSLSVIKLFYFVLVAVDLVFRIRPQSLACFVSASPPSVSNSAPRCVCDVCSSNVDGVGLL